MKIKQFQYIILLGTDSFNTLIRGEALQEQHMRVVSEIERRDFAFCGIQMWGLPISMPTFSDYEGEKKLK